MKRMHVNENAYIHINLMTDIFSQTDVRKKHKQKANDWFTTFSLLNRRQWQWANKNDQNILKCKECCNAKMLCFTSN